MTLYEVRTSLSSGATIYDLPLKVVYYARVSTDKYEQLNSLENQVTYYEDYIRNNPNWSLIGGYVDEGISGTSVEKRDAFKKMIKDAKAHKFDLIITKEISRFARDTLDSIKYTRKLLEYEVGVLFQYDNINTFIPDSELRLTIMASIAQEEVRKLSERVKFGFARSIEDGHVLGNKNIWGYTKDKCKLVIVEEEAIIIREIFNMYVNEHIGMRTISNKLAQKGYLNKNGKPFTQGTIKYILTNPKYKGFYCGNRTKTIDYHSKQRVSINQEEWKVYKDYVTVPPIVSESLWNKAQEILQTRSSKSAKDKMVYQNRYPFSGKIICAKHNTTYRRKVNTSSGVKRKKVVTWRCSKFLNSNLQACNGPIIYDDELKEIVANLILKYLSSTSVIDNLINEYKEVLAKTNYSQEIEKREQEIQLLEKKKSKILDLILKELVTENDFKKQSDEIITKIKNLENEVTELKLKSKNSKSNFEYLEELRKKATRKLTYENADVDSLIWEFLEKIEVLEPDNSNTINLRIILNTGNQFSIVLNQKKHPFGINYTHDKS